MRPDLVKICGITREVDAQSCLDLGADALGFIFHPSSPRNISLDNYETLTNKLKFGSLLKVAVAVCPEPLMVDQFVETGFDKFQFHFPSEYPIDKIKFWSKAVGFENLWLAPRLKPGEEFSEEYLQYAQSILIDAFSLDTYGGTGKLADLTRFSVLKNQYPDRLWFLAGGLNPENLPKVLQETKPDGIDLNSGVESLPGIKDVKKLKQAFSLF